MKNHKLSGTVSQYRMRQRWYAFALGITVLLISLMIGCTDQSQPTSAERIDPEGLNAAPDAPPLVIEPNAVIANPRHFLVQRTRFPLRPRPLQMLRGPGQRRLGERAG